VRRTTGAALLLLSFWLIAAPHTALALRHAAPAASQVLALQTRAPTGRIVIKFAAASPLAMGDGDLLIGARSEAGLRFSALLAAAAPAGRLERRFSRPAARIDGDRRAAEALTGILLPDLNRYAQLVDAAPASDHDALLAILRVLLSDPAVELAFLEPVAVPAALGFDAFAPDGQAGAAAPAGAGERSPQTTPDFGDLQGYLDPAPDGIDAFALADSVGGDGAGVQFIDVEGAWLWTHEDLPAPFIEIGVQIDNLGWRNHGSAVLGEIRGIDNGLGVRGIAPALAVGASSIAEQSVADAIDNAAAALSTGDIILIELHAPGPNATGSGQYGYVCMEFWQDNFDVILLASAAGLIVCETAGNGAEDFDDPVYMGLFDRNVRDSGAILLGATNHAILAPAWFTNYGTRVDLNGWGSFVVSCGYGNLQGEGGYPEEEWYTDSFSGTSSAGPIVAGAVASLQGTVKEHFGFPIDARLMRDILNETGTEMELLLERMIGQGSTVTTGDLVQLYPRIRGIFHGPTDTFDPSRHTPCQAICGSYRGLHRRARDPGIGR
jgi:serine protease